MLNGDRHQARLTVPSALEMVQLRATPINRDVTQRKAWNTALTTDEWPRAGSRRRIA